MNNLLQTTEERLKRLERYVERIEAAIKELEDSTARGDLESLNEDQIRYYLSHTPDMIASAGLFLAKIERAYSYAKLDAKIIFSELWKEANQNREALSLTNAKDRDAYVLSDKRYIEAQHQEMEWKYNLDRARIVYERYDNMFVACRKLCSILPNYYQAQDNYSKYNQEA